jgi:hypothetical protein
MSLIYAWARCSVHDDDRDMRGAVNMMPPTSCIKLVCEEVSYTATFIEFSTT